MKSTNVISLQDRLEKWSTVYRSPTGEFTVRASNRGILKIDFDKSKVVCLDFFESVKFLSDVSKGFEEMTLDTFDAL